LPYPLLYIYTGVQCGFRLGRAKVFCHFPLFKEIHSDSIMFSLLTTSNFKQKGDHTHPAPASMCDYILTRHPLPRSLLDVLLHLLDNLGCGRQVYMTSLGDHDVVFDANTAYAPVAV
jgi:hypothetical protein